MRRQWHPTPVLLPGKSHGWGSLVGCSPWGREQSDNWATSLSLSTFMHWSREWQPTPVFLLENPRDEGAWWNAVYGVTQSRTRLKWLSSSSRGTREQIANICWIIEKAREFQKNIYSALLTTSKPLTVWIPTNWKILKEMGIPDHMTCLLRNLYVGEEGTVRTGHRPTDWFQIGKGVCQGCISSPYLFNLYAEYIMWNVGLEEA